MSTDDHDQTLDLEQVLAILRRRAPVIALCLVLVTASAFVFSKGQTKKYTATASLVFNNAQISQQVAGLQATGGSEPKAQQSTNVKLLELGATAEQTAQKLSAGLTGKQVKESLEVSAEGESNVVDVVATWTSPSMAATIANTYVKQFVADQLAANHGYFATAQALVEKQLHALSPQQRVGPQGLALQDRAQSLAILSELKAGDVQLAQQAVVPTSPSSPKVARNTILGAVLGLLLGVGLAFLFERLDQRIREPRDLERIFGLPLLGVVPESAQLSRHSDGPEDALHALPDAEAEVFRMLRAHLRYFNVDRDLRTLLIASAAPGDGKSTVARNLAEAAATMGSRVLLMETDLRRPTLGKRLAVAPNAGLAGVLIGALTLGEALHTIALDPTLDGRQSSGRSLDVLSAGAVAPPNPAELIESQAMKSLLSHVPSDYDLVVIDTPPLTVVSDAFPLLSQVDGVVIVGRVGRNRRDVAARLHEILEGVEAPLLGVVANGFKPGRLGSYSYGYGYGYSYDEAGPPAPRPTAQAPQSTPRPHPRRRAPPISRPAMAAAGRLTPNRLCLRSRVLPLCLGLVALLAPLGGGVMAAGARADALKAVVGPGLVGGVSRFPIYRDLGMRIYEDHLLWNTTAPTRPRHPTDPSDPAYVWPAEVTAAVAEASRYHMRVALQIIGAPSWANGGKPWNWAPNPRDFANFASAAARRYPSVHLWEIWVEPSRKYNFEPLMAAKRRSGPLGVHERSAPHRYARMLDAAYGALKRVSRSNLVIGGMTYTTGEISPQQWIENLRLPNGRPARLDMYGHNPFSFRDPNLSNPPSPEQDIDFSDLGRLAKLVARYLGRPGNRHPKLFISEWTVPTAIDTDFNFYVDKSVQAKWITDSLRIGRQLKSIYAIGWIHMFDEPPHSLGGLLETDGVKKPGYYAWKNG